MNTRLALLCLIGLAGVARAGAEEDAAAIADRYLAFMRGRGYAFLTEEELARRRDEVAAFVAKHLRSPFDEAARAALLDGVDHCLDRLYKSPAGTVEYGNGFGSGGEEWMYLQDRDCFRTFLYQLWVGLTRQALTPEAAERRDAQRAWMREYLTYGPWRERDPIRNEKIRAKVLAKLERSFGDPLDLLSQPMSDDAFAEMRRRLRDASRGIDGDLVFMRVTALGSRFPSAKDPAGRHGYVRGGELPFDDTVMSLWAHGQLCFASNADFCGSHGSVSASDVFDVVRCMVMWTKPAPAPGSAAMEEWIAAQGRGELTLDGSTLVAVRGAAMAELPVKTWFEADKLSDEALRAVLRDGGRDRIAIDRLPRMNGPHRGDRSEGEFFLVVRNREDRLAVLNLHNYEFGQLMLWCRPRGTRP